MARFKRHFTVKEANDLLPTVREILQRLQLQGVALAASWEGVVPALQAAPHNGGSAAAADYLRALNRFNLQLRRLGALGILLKDVERGLVDFPHLRDGEEVFLCYELSEERVAFWHRIDSGYASRRAL